MKKLRNISPTMHAIRKKKTKEQWCCHNLNIFRMESADMNYAWLSDEEVFLTTWAHTWHFISCRTYLAVEADWSVCCERRAITCKPTVNAFHWRKAIKWSGAAEAWYCVKNTQQASQVRLQLCGQPFTRCTHLPTSGISAEDKCRRVLSQRYHSLALTTAAPAPLHLSTGADVDCVFFCTSSRNWLKIFFSLRDRSSWLNVISARFSSAL